MYPYCVEVENDAFLYERNDGRFQIIKHAPLDDVMLGYRFILVSQTVIDVLAGMNVKHVIFEPAIIWWAKEGIEYTSHAKMKVRRHFESEKIYDLDLSGSEFLLMDNRHLFVTPDLKAKIESTSLNWKFSQGLQNFG